MLDYREHYRRNLPHWQPEGATLFVTTRLAGSLPQEVIAALIAEREREKKALSALVTREEREKQDYQDERQAFGRWEAALDRAESGPHWLGQPQVAQVVTEALHYRDSRVYDLLAFCVMPNHLHIVITPLQNPQGEYYLLHRIMQSLKRHTARRSNEKLGRQGAFWQAESYDHVVRNEAELRRIVHYVVHNPVKAGLVSQWEEWPWTYCKSECHSDLRS